MAESEELAKHFEHWPGKVQHCSIWRHGGPDGNPPPREIWAGDLIDGSELYTLFRTCNTSSFLEKWTSSLSDNGSPQ